MLAQEFAGQIFLVEAWSRGSRGGAFHSTYVDDLLSGLRASNHVVRAVLLDTDGGYDAAGRLDRARTHLLVSNDYVLLIAGKYSGEFLAGVSINPQRHDAQEEVERCADAGPVLVKVLPAAQGFDPGNSRYVPFYRALARYGLPFAEPRGV